MPQIQRPPSTPLARKLQERCRQLDIRQADLIRLLGDVSPATVQHWMSGRRQPTLDHLRRLADVLQTSVAALVADDPDYAHTAEERLALRLLRRSSPEMRQAMLALLQAQQKPE